MEQRMVAKTGLARLTGSADRIMLLALPVLALGVVLNVLYPAFFSVGGPAAWLRVVSVVVLIPGVIVWLWSVVLILTKVPQGELITGGPYRLVKHPLYTGVALLVLPWAGFLFNTWLGVVVGLVVYGASRVYAPAEERELAAGFGKRWEVYLKKVLLPWV